MENTTLSSRIWIWTYSILGSLYGVWMLYSSSIANILISALLYAPGVFLYIKTRREDNLPLFPKLIDKVVLVILLSMAILSAILLLNGTITL